MCISSVRGGVRICQILRKEEIITSAGYRVPLYYVDYESRETDIAVASFKQGIGILFSVQGEELLKKIVQRARNEWHTWSTDLKGNRVIRLKSLAEIPRNILHGFILEVIEDYAFGPISFEDALERLKNDCIQEEVSHSDYYALLNRLGSGPLNERHQPKDALQRMMVTVKDECIKKILEENLQADYEEQYWNVVLGMLELEAKIEKIRRLNFPLNFFVLDLRPFLSTSQDERSGYDFAAFHLARLFSMKLFGYEVTDPNEWLRFLYDAISDYKKYLQFEERLKTAADEIYHDVFKDRKEVEAIAATARDVYRIEPGPIPESDSDLSLEQI
jgi:hypothetical protein